MSVDVDAAVNAEVNVELGELYDRLRRTGSTSLGFPDARDINYKPLRRFADRLINNIGDPSTDGAYPQHTKVQERYVVATIADILGFPADDRVGYVTGGATEGSEAALLTARRRYPEGIVYHSAATHFAVVEVIERLGMRSITVRCDDDEQMVYDDLLGQVGQHRDRPVIVVANAGTGMHEAVDDLREISAVLDDLAVRRRFVHVDAALSGIALALLEPQARPRFDLADSVIVSGHKFFGTPAPCGVVVVKGSHRGHPSALPYTGSAHTTVSNSRNGFAALALWYALRILGPDGLRRRGEDARAVAEYAQQRLTEIEWGATRHRHSMTVVLPAPPAAVADKWALPVHGGCSHIVCVPGVTRAMIDDFVADLQCATATVDVPTVPARRAPLPRRPANAGTAAR